MQQVNHKVNLLRVPLCDFFGVRLGALSMDGNRASTSSQQILARGARGGRLFANIGRKRSKRLGGHMFVMSRFNFLETCVGSCDTHIFGEVHLVGKQFDIETTHRQQVSLNLDHEAW